MFCTIIHLLQTVSGHLPEKYFVFPKMFLCFRVRVEVTVIGNTFSVKRPFEANVLHPLQTCKFSNKGDSLQVVVFQLLN